MKTSLLFISIFLAVLVTSNTQTVGAGFDNQYKPEKTNVPSTGAPTTGFPEISFNFLDSPLVDIIWCGEKKNTVFILTEKNTVYRSTDDGFTGHTLNTHLDKLGQRELTNPKGEVGQVTRFIQSPIDPNLMIFLGTEGINWVTEDCGKSVKAMDQGRRVEDFHFHPTERTWLLAAAWTVCDDFVNEPCRKYRELFYSKDLGENWGLISDYVYQFSWGITDDSFFNIPKERILVCHEPKGRGHQTISGWNEKLFVSYSDDFFNTTRTLVKGGNKFLLVDNYIFVVRVDNEEEEEVTLLVGSSREKEYFHLKPIELPVKHLLEHSYTILDTSEHAIFLHINHDGERSQYGNIYVSDWTGHRFSLALKGNVRNVDGQCDFERIQGLEGIYLANTYDTDELSKHKQHIDNGVPIQGPGSKKTTYNTSSTKMSKSSGSAYGSSSYQKSLEDFKKTMISFDKGGMWQRLTPPDKDSDGKRIYCSDLNCGLNLHSISSNTFGPFYTTENSMGIVIGTGNVGEYLSNRADQINTYLSRDGGLTWLEIAKGSHIYEIGDHGAIIVMANNQVATTNVLFSWNEGLTWETLKVSDEPIEITNIIIEPSNTAEKFVVYGRTAGMDEKGVIIAVDFMPVHQRYCRNPDRPNTPDSDYETWSPNGKINSHCLLGRNIEYIRKKREAECFNSEEHENWNFIKNCECTEEDWECDYGFYRKDSTGPCLNMNNTEINYTAPAQCSGYFFVSQGYRKIPGDTCFGGVNHESLRLPCPGSMNLHSSNILVFVVLIVVVLGLIQLSKKGNMERFKDTFAEIVNNILSMVRGSGGSSDGRARRPDYMKFDENARNDEEGFGGLVFEDEEEEPAAHLEDKNLLEVAQGKRKTEGKALETAQKKVPVLLKPGEKKREIDLFQ